MGLTVDSNSFKEYIDQQSGVCQLEKYRQLQKLARLLLLESVLMRVDFVDLWRRVDRTKLTAFGRRPLGQLEGRLWLQDQHAKVSVRPQATAARTSGQFGQDEPA